MLVVGLTILLFVMLVINVYILAYWQHPDDKNESYLVRLLIIYGLQLCAVSVLMLPVGKAHTRPCAWPRPLTLLLNSDVANNEGNPGCDSTSLLFTSSNAYCGGIDMLAVWEAFFCMICFSVVVFIPFATFYYEADSYDLVDMAKRKSRLLPALCQETVVVAFFLIVLLALYFTKSYAELPVQEMAVPVSSLSLTNYTRAVGSSPYTFLDLSLPPAAPVSNATSSDALLIMPTDFAVYCIALFSWVAWWMFSMFVGVGLACAPFDLVTAYIWRPKVMAPDALANKELELQEKCADLLEVTALLKRDRLNLNDGTAKAKRAMKLRYLPDRMEVNKLTQMVFILERDLEEYRACKVVRKGYNPLRPYVNLGGGVFFALLSVLWLLQIILAMLTTPQASPFLSLYLVTFDVWFPMFGNLTYALLSLYLLIATVKGAFKLSVRFFCCKLHPMQVGGTLINAFLFNLGIVMVCTVPLVHFCVTAFSGYTVDSDAFFLFVVQVNNVAFFRTFFRGKVFIWAMLIIACALLPYLFWRPRDQAVSTEDFRRNLHERSAASAGENAYATLGKHETEMTKV